MRTIGMLGGMSWESSIVYERIINEEVRDRLGGDHAADLLIRSYDFAAIHALQDVGDWDTAGKLLADDARWLVDGGAEVIVIATNTMHRVADDLEAALADTPAHLLHMADATAAAAHEVGATTVGLLGTRFTMEQAFMVDRLAATGLDVRVPPEQARTTVHDVIYDELVRGVVSDESRAAYLAIIDDLVTDGAQAIIAGCTEIELLVADDDIAVPLLPTARLHALATVDAALSP